VEDFKLDIEVKLEDQREGALLFEDQRLTDELETMLGGRVGTKRAEALESDRVIAESSCSPFIHGSEEGGRKRLNFHCSIMEK
jgi:hypothetical protein